MKSPLRLLQALLADVGERLPGVTGLDRDLITIESRLKNEGIGFITVAFSAFSDSILDGLRSGRLRLPIGFKRSGRSALPCLFKGLLSEVFESATGCVLSEPNVHAISSLHQITRLFRKATFTENEKYLDLKAKDDFYGTDDIRFEFLPNRLHRIHRVGSYILDSLNRRLDDGDEFKYTRHGPGAVFEKKLYGNSKWRRIGHYVRSGRDIFPESAIDLLYVNCADQVEPVFSNTTVPSDVRLVTVPKSISARRAITVEPLMNQFYQQGLNSVIRKSIDSCDILSNCITLTDQTRNQNLAMIGSRTGEWSTIDLKSASDSLSHKLVKEVFCRFPSLMEKLDRCRSLNGGKPFNKYAGMGNATTFPIQSIVFAVLAICARLDSKARINREDVVNASRYVRVYGDDIIVHKDDTPAVVDWITSHGLRVNPTKSFWTGKFRESCGVDAYDGTDVTPIYARCDPRCSIGDNNVESWVSTANQFFGKGYYNTYAYLRNLVTVQYGKIPDCISSEGVIGFVTSVGTARLRVSKTLQRLEQLVLVSKPKMKKSRLSGYEALLKFYLTPLIERDKNHLKESAERYNNEIVRRWMPVHR